MIRDIVIVNDYAWISGGLTKIAIDGAIGLAKIGAKVTFIAIAGPVEERLRDSGVNVLCMNQPDIWDEPDRKKAMVRGMWNKSAMNYVRREMSGFDPKTTILHCQGYSRALSPAIGKLMVDGGFPHVYSMHDYALACPNGTFFHHPEKKICTRKPLGKACLTTNCDTRSPLHKAWRIGRQVVTNKVAGIPQGFKDLIYTSEIHRNVIEPYLDPKSRLHFVPNPISIDKGPRITAENNDVYLFISRLVPEKGAVLFAKAAKAAGVRAVFVGDGPDRDEVLSIIPDAHITGWVSPTGVETWLERARCLVFPSLWYDASPLTVPEALAKGIPAIVGNWNAGSTPITEGRNGFIVPDKAPATWTDYIKRMQASDVGAMSHAAYDDYWAGAVDQEEHARLLMDVYEKAISAQQG